VNQVLEPQQVKGCGPRVAYILDSTQLIDLSRIMRFTFISASEHPVLAPEFPDQRAGSVSSWVPLASG